MENYLIKLFSSTVSRLQRVPTFFLNQNKAFSTRLIKEKTKIRPVLNNETDFF